MMFTKWIPSMIFCKKKLQVSKGPEKVMKGRNAKLLDQCTSTVYTQAILYVQNKNRLKDKVLSNKNKYSWLELFNIQVQYEIVVIQILCMLTLN